MKAEATCVPVRLSLLLLLVVNVYGGLSMEWLSTEEITTIEDSDEHFSGRLDARAPSPPCSQYPRTSRDYCLCVTGRGDTWECTYDCTCVAEKTNFRYSKCRINHPHSSFNLVDATAPLVFLLENLSQYWYLFRCLAAVFLPVVPLRLYISSYVIKPACLGNKGKEYPFSRHPALTLTIACKLYLQPP